MGKLKVLVVLILVVAVIGGGAMFYLKKDLIFGPETEKAITAEELAELSIDTDVITTNLASASNFAIVQFNILLSSEEAKEETEKRTPEVRAAIISTIAGLTKNQLVGGEGITTLEKELSSKLSKIVETGKVERVLVTEFKVQ
jgi:flagellar FliL protein